jgi:hypothetical protein
MLGHVLDFIRFTRLSSTGGYSPFLCSDHSYVFLRITLPSMLYCGPGVWKFNTSLLEDEVFTARIRISGVRGKTNVTLSLS